MSLGLAVAQTGPGHVHEAAAGGGAVVFHPTEHPTGLGLAMMGQFEHRLTLGVLPLHL